MPAKKDSSLNKRHDSKEDRAARAAAEESLKPTTKLTTTPPGALNGHAQAKEVWKRTIGLYLETKGEIITAFDQDLLVKYCLAEEELKQLAAIREAVLGIWNVHVKVLESFKSVKKIKSEDLNYYYKALKEANASLQRFQGMDARLDGKRKMSLAMEQSLYLTPRSRAGVAPEEKDPDEPQSEMDNLIDG
jgi:phage terminase small subunit